MSESVTLETLFAHLWEDYQKITPQAEHVHSLLKKRGESFRNDHIALRTYNIQSINLEKLAEPFTTRGYVESGQYQFAIKKLRAKSFSHPSGTYPRVFISELLTEEFTPGLQATVKNIVAEVRENTSGETLLLKQPTWAAVPYETYRSLLQESEFAAWVAAFGIRANHFTVAFNDLKTFTELAELNDFLRKNGYTLNGEGTQIQGTPRDLLEQSSTRAQAIPWTFAEGETHAIPSCYYEFAKRYSDPRTGKLFDGFVSESADKIFHSTDVGGSLDGAKR